MIQKRPTKLWSETYGALPLSYSATTLGLRWWDSNPRPPAYKACTPSRQSVLFHWPGDEVVVRRIALPLSYTHHRINRVGDRNRTDNRCTPTGSRRGQSHFSKETANEGIGSDRTVVNVVQTGSWPSETPVGVEPTSTGLQPAAWPSGSSVKYPRQESNLIPDLRRVVCDPPHPEDEIIPARIRTRIQTLGKSDVVPLHHQDKEEPTAGFAPA
jgi:hypothetical protein